MVAVDSVAPSPENPRTSAGDVTELAASIQAVGIIEPLIVRSTGEGSFVLIAGERRLTAAKSVGLAEVPVIVRDLDDAKGYEIALIDNLHREDLTALEEAQAYRRLIKEFGYTQRSLAKLVGHSQPHISRRLSLLDLPEKVRADLDTGGITLPDAVELAKLAKMPERLESARKRGAMYGTISAAVARELQEHERGVAGRKLRKQLVADGVTLVEWPQQGGWWNQETKPLTHLGWVDAEAHATEPCHAGSVSPQAEVVWLCTTPENHPRPEREPGEGYQGGGYQGGAGYGVGASVDDPAERARLEEQRQRAQEHREALDKAREARGVHMRDLLTRRLPKPELAEHLALSFVLNGQGIEWDDYSQACDLLGVDDEEAPNPVEALMAHAVAGGVEAAARVGLALTFVLAEANITGSWNQSWGDARLHLAFLQRHGYVVSEAEQEELDAALPESDDQADADGSEAQGGDDAEQTGDEPEQEAEVPGIDEQG
jgi:ParB/RepB/Spo0J family partition protein